MCSRSGTARSGSSTFDNPEFGVYFLRLTSERLLRDVGRLEARLRAAGA